MYIRQPKKVITKYLPLQEAGRNPRWYLHQSDSLAATFQGLGDNETLQSRDVNTLSSDAKLSIALGVVLGVFLVLLVPVAALSLYRYQKRSYLNQRLPRQYHGRRYRHRRGSKRITSVLGQTSVVSVRGEGQDGGPGAHGNAGSPGRDGGSGGIGHPGGQGRGRSRVNYRIEGGRARGGGVRIRREGPGNGSGDNLSAGGGSATGGRGQGGDGGGGGTGGAGGKGGDGGRGGAGSARAEARASVYLLLMCCFLGPPSKRKKVRRSANPLPVLSKESILWKMIPQYLRRFLSLKGL
ncbi:hypothetical protein GGR52DRAFT_564652 [Hypoxylon sp. FL1284]|nr:hypothetical protein GGR52DRAFT_564652 [Hypoxylon sp. FL1284]